MSIEYLMLHLCVSMLYALYILRDILPHKKIEHEGQRHVCSKCGKPFKQITQMKVHEDYCGTDKPKPFQCDHCTYNTTQNDCLTSKETNQHKMHTIFSIGFFKTHG